MTYWQLGAKEKARECYTRAVRQMRKSPPLDNNMDRIRSEAAALFGIKEESTKKKEESPKQK